MCFKTNTFFLFTLLVSVASLAFAYISQYGFNLQPCELCYWQRVPYFTIIAISLVALFLRKYQKMVCILSILIILGFFIEAGVASFHVGVEYKWWEGTDSCGTGDNVPQTVEEMRAMILKAPNARCDEPAFEFLGISMAGYNAIWSLLLGLTTLCAVRRVKQNGC